MTPPPPRSSPLSLRERVRVRGTLSPSFQPPSLSPSRILFTLLLAAFVFCATQSVQASLSAGQSAAAG